MCINGCLLIHSTELGQIRGNLGGWLLFQVMEKDQTCGGDKVTKLYIITNATASKDLAVEKGSKSRKRAMKFPS
jgi:hypothetical protein